MDFTSEVRVDNLFVVAVLEHMVQIKLGGILGLFFRKVHNPKSGLLALATVGVLEDILLLGDFHFDIVELSPDVSVVVLNEGVVVA